MAVDISKEIKQAVHDAFAELPFEQRMAMSEKTLKVLSDIVTGNGNPETGLVMKTDRNTQAISFLVDSQKKRADREWGLWAAFIVSFAVSVMNLVIK